MDDVCRREMPPAEDIGDGHSVHCFKHGESLRGRDTLDYFDKFQTEAERILGSSRV